MGGKSICRCPHHKAKPFLTILAGIAIVLGSLGKFSWEMTLLFVGILLILAGIFKMTQGMCKCCDGNVCHYC